MNWRDRLKKKKRRGRPSFRELREERVEPTTQTLERLQPDPILQLVEAGLINSEGEKAAAEIQAVYKGLCRGAWLRASTLGEEFGMARAGSGDISDTLAYAHSATWMIWVGATAANVVELVVSAAVNRNPVPEALRPDLADALNDYAKRMARRPRRH